MTSPYEPVLGKRENDRRIGRAGRCARRGQQAPIFSSRLRRRWAQRPTPPSALTLKGHFSALATLACLFILTSLAFASPRGDAWKLHKAGRNAEAVPLLLQATQANPNDAKAYWFLAQVYDDMGRGGDGLQALQTARRLDPALGFASSPTSVTNIEASLTRKAGGGTSSSSNAIPTRRTRSAGASASGGGELSNQKEILTALQQSGVYVAPSMQNVANPTQIAQQVHEVGAPFTTNVLVVSSMPRRYRSIGQWAEAENRNLNLGNGLMIVVTSHDVGAYGANLAKAELQNTVQASAKTFTAEGYPAGIAQITRMASEAHSSNKSHQQSMIFLIIAIPAGIIIFLMQRRKKQSAQELGQIEGEANEVSAKIAPAFEKLDSDFEYALLAEKDPARKQLLEERRDRVGQMFSGGMKQLQNATTAGDFLTARNALQATQVEMQRAHNILQRKPEDEGVQQLQAATPAASGSALPHHATGSPLPSANSGDVVEIPPIGANYPGAQQDYALDFFTSQPVPIAQMVPVEIEVNGQRRRVWASPQSAQSALAGNPQIATMNYQGQSRPWFDVPQTQYNPWHDFGSTMLQMMAFNMMWDAMTDRHSYYNSGWGGGYGGGGYGWNDYNQGGYINRDAGYDNRMQDAGSAAGAASINSPISGGWDTTPDNAGSASLDVFGGGGVSGGGSS